MDSASPSFYLQLPQASPSLVPPERLPRRAVRGLGVHSPHQIGSFLPTNFFEEPLRLLKKMCG
jgi:hypothetical protein